MPGEVDLANGARREGEARQPASRSRPPVDGVGVGERCHAVVRPEKLRDPALERRRAGPAGPPVEGMVESSVYLGTATQIVVGLPGDVRMTVLVPNADEAERARLPGGGAPVRLCWAPEHIHVVRESDRARRAEASRRQPSSDAKPGTRVVELRPGAGCVVARRLRRRRLGGGATRARRSRPPRPGRPWAS